MVLTNDEKEEQLNGQINSNGNAINMKILKSTVSTSKGPDDILERKNIYAAYDGDVRHSKYWRSLQSVKPVRLHK